MSLTLLPAVDVRDGKAVRLRQGESGSETDYGSPLEAARMWVESGAEWIHLVDLDAAYAYWRNLPGGEPLSVPIPPLTREIFPQMITL